MFKYGVVDMFNLELIKLQASSVVGEECSCLYSDDSDGCIVIFEGVDRKLILSFVPGDNSLFFSIDSVDDLSESISGLVISIAPLKNLLSWVCGKEEVDFSLEGYILSSTKEI